MGGIYSDFVKNDVTPNWREEPKYEREGKPREMIATPDEMALAGVEPQYRDYCAHKLIDFYKCRRDNFPWGAACKHERHAWDECQYDDWIIRMKEYERERRLLERSSKKSNSEDAE